MLIAINGAIGEGKDTVAEMIQAESPFEFELKKFADKLKEIVCVLTGCERQQLESQEFKTRRAAGDILHPLTRECMTYRELLQYLGTDLFRDRLDPDIWVKSALTSYSDNKNYIITDMRFENEFRAIQRRGGITVLVQRFKIFEEWLREYEDLLLPNVLGLFSPDALEKKVSKQGFFDFLEEHKFANTSHPGYLNAFHRGERELWKLQRSGAIQFDVIISNDCSLEVLRERILDFISQNIMTYATKPKNLD